MNIIGISGLAGSGKDTVADFLLEHDGFIKISLADPIKRFAMDVWEFSEEQLWGPSKYRNSLDNRYPQGDTFLSPRLVLQHIGTEGARHIDGDVWIRYAIRTAIRLIEAKPKHLCYSQAGGIKPYFEGCSECSGETIDGFPAKVKAVIIPDCRFKNEIREIKAAGGIMIRVVRPGAGLNGDFALHQSEVEMAEIPDSEFDIVIQNTGTLEDLKSLVNEFVVALSHEST